jgi:hypothetical protein
MQPESHDWIVSISLVSGVMRMTPSSRTSGSMSGLPIHCPFFYAP